MAVAAVLMVGGGPLNLWAQVPGPEVLRQIAAISAEKAARTPAELKIDSQLLYAAREYLGIPRAPGVPALLSGVTTDSTGGTLVDIEANVTAALLERIAALGGTVVSTYPQYGAIRARVPIDAIEELAAAAGVRFIRPAEQPITRRIVSEGDITHRADLARADFDVDGAGVTVGVLSDDVNQLVPLQDQGDLPPDCPAGPPCVTVLPGQEGGGSSEGTAMLDIVHSLAPGSNLAFATGGTGQAAMAANIVALQAAGARVIVDDVGYLEEPVFQDGVIAQAVNTVVQNGAVYLSSAGNDGNEADGTSGTWEGNYVAAPLPAPLTGDGVSALDFGGGQVTNAITETGESYPVGMEWSDPWGASANDYDLYLLDPTGSTVVAASTNRQTGSQDPVEAITVGTDITHDLLVVVLYAGQPRFIHLAAPRRQLQLNTTGATYGHPATSAAIGMAAVNVATAGCPQCTPFTGGTANPVETFSSDGPRRIFFDASGNPITPGNFLAGGGELLDKPDLTAADGVSTATIGFDPFFGTSAAAPHAAAIAALMLSFNPLLTQAQVRKILTATALPVADPSPGFLSGAGIADALGAVAAAAPTPVPGQQAGVINMPGTVTATIAAGSGAAAGGFSYTNTTNAVQRIGSITITASGPGALAALTLAAGSQTVTVSPVRSSNQFGFLPPLAVGPGATLSFTVAARTASSVAAMAHAVAYAALLGAGGWPGCADPAMVGLLMGLCLLIGPASRRRRGIAIAGLILLAMSAAAAGCGGSSSSGKPPSTAVIQAINGTGAVAPPISLSVLTVVGGAAGATSIQQLTALGFE